MHRNYFLAVTAVSYAALNVVASVLLNSRTVSAFIIKGSDLMGRSSLSNILDASQSNISDLVLAEEDARNLVTMKNKSTDDNINLAARATLNYSGLKHANIVTDQDCTSINFIFDPQRDLPKNTALPVSASIIATTMFPLPIITSDLLSVRQDNVDEWYYPFTDIRGQTLHVDTEQLVEQFNATNVEVSGQFCELGR